MIYQDTFVGKLQILVKIYKTEVKRRVEKSGKTVKKASQFAMFAGLWRNDCNNLHCIEYFKCCKMAMDAKFSIVVRDMKKGYTKKCTMTVCIMLGGFLSSTLISNARLICA